MKYPARKLIFCLAVGVLLLAVSVFTLFMFSSLNITRVRSSQRIQSLQGMENMIDSAAGEMEEVRLAYEKARDVAFDLAADAAREFVRNGEIRLLIVREEIPLS